MVSDIFKYDNIFKYDTEHSPKFLKFLVKGVMNFAPVLWDKLWDRTKKRGPGKTWTPE